MDWKDVGNYVANHAPEIGATLGSLVPGVGTVAGGAAGAGIKAIAGMFGMTDLAGPEAVLSAIQADPQAALKLKMADMDFKLRNRELDIAELKEQQSVYIEELRTKTIPWVDAIHKLGRQLLNLFNLIAVVVLMLNGKSITPEVALLLGGPNVAYQIIKGKGNQGNGNGK